MAPIPSKKNNNITPKETTLQGRGQRSRTRLEKVEAGHFPLERTNFIIMIVSAVAIVLGFILMLGGSSTETEFNPDIFSTRRIVIGPTIAFLGFVAMGIGVIYLPRRRKNNTADNPAADKE